MLNICYVQPPALVFQCAGCRSILSDSHLFVCSVEALNVLVVTGMENKQGVTTIRQCKGWLHSRIKQLQAQAESTLNQLPSLATCFRRQSGTGKLFCLCMAYHVVSIISMQHARCEARCLGALQCVYGSHV